MRSLIRFSPDLSAWILHNLNQGCAPAALIDIMQQQKMAPQAAHAIIDAFVIARQSGRPVPVDSVEMDEQAPNYEYGTPIFLPGTSIRTIDRVVRITAKAERPTLAVLSDVLSADECDELIALAKHRLKPSTVVDPETGQDMIAAHRSSFGMFFGLQENPFIAKLDRRIADVMNMPIEHGEGIQVLRYLPGATSSPHFDFLVPSNPANIASLARSGQRVSTLVTYLNDVEEGGETVFPAAGWTISPQRGNAVYFEYCNRLNQLNHASLHASNPIARGEKWVATKWMRQRRFVPAKQQGGGASRINC